MKEIANKLTIRSRPVEEIKVGSGAISLNISIEQLYLITALACNCRLGQSSVYSQAAYDLITIIEDEYGDDFTSDACDDVGLQVTIEDGNGNALTTAGTGAYITLEV